MPPIEPQKAGFSAERLNRIEEFFSGEIAQNRVPGAVVGIVRDGKIVYLKAFGYRDKEKDSDSLIVLGARESRVHGEAAKQMKTDRRETSPARREAGN